MIAISVKACRLVWEETKSCCTTAKWYKGWQQQQHNSYRRKAIGVGRSATVHWPRITGWKDGELSVEGRGSQRDVVYLGWPIAPSYMSPNAGGGWELRGLSQWVQLFTWSPNKLWRSTSNSIFSLWLKAIMNEGTVQCMYIQLQDRSASYFLFKGWLCWLIVKHSHTDTVTLPLQYPSTLCLSSPGTHI